MLFGYGRVIANWRRTEQPRLLLAIAVLIFAQSAAAAMNIDPAKLDAVDKAVTEFQAMAKDAVTTGNPPRQTDPKVKALLDTIFDTAELASMAPLPLEDINGLTKWLTQVRGVGGVYLLAGAGVADPGKPRERNTEFKELMVRNAVAFMPEIGRYYDASVELAAAISEGIAASMTAAPDRFASPRMADLLAQQRSFLVLLVKAAMSSAEFAEVDPRWVGARIATLQMAAPALAKFLTADDHHGLHEYAERIADEISDPESKRALANFVRAIGP